LSEIEFNAVFEVDQETVPGRSAEWITGYRHESNSGIINIINNGLNAINNAQNNESNNSGNS